MKSKITVLLALFALVFAFAACSDDGGNGGNGSSTSAPSSYSLTTAYSNLNLTRWEADPANTMNNKIIFVRTSDVALYVGNGNIADAGVEFYSWPCGGGHATNATWSETPVSTWANAESFGSGEFFDAGYEFTYFTVASNADGTITVKLTAEGIVNNISHVEAQNSASWNLVEALGNGSVSVFGIGETGVDSNSWFGCWGSPSTPFTPEGQSAPTAPASISFNSNAYIILSGTTNTVGVTVKDASQTSGPLSVTLKSNDATIGTLSVYLDSNTGYFTNSFTVATNSGTGISYQFMGNATLKAAYSTAPEASASVVTEFLTKRFYVDPWTDWTAAVPNCYKYGGIKGELASWPGAAMTDDGDGWFYIDIEEYGSFTVIFNDVGGSDQQTANLGVSTDSTSLYYKMTNGTSGDWQSSK